MNESEKKPETISVIVPVYNEESSLLLLYEEIADVMPRLAEEFEVIFVDDGSTDGSVEVLSKLQGKDRRVRMIGFSRNRGKSAVYMAGFEAARGEFVVTLDGDRQDDPSELPGVLAALYDGKYDLVVGWKRKRFANEPLKAIPSKAFNLVLGALFGFSLHDSNSGFRVMHSDVAQALNLYGDLYRFIPELAYVQGFRVGEFPVAHRKREEGRSKYGPSRFWTGLLDLITVRFITKYIDRPLHFFGSVGMVPIVLGVALEVYVLAMKLVWGEPFRDHLAALIIGVMLLILGVQVFVTGLIGEMLTTRMHRELVRGREEIPRGRRKGVGFSIWESDQAHSGDDSLPRSGAKGAMLVEEGRES